ncbi:MAG: hypothetical protein RLZ53_391 [Actinomycetota bacterium]
MRTYKNSDLKDLATDQEHKALMLSMLIEFDKFCNAHGLTYYLSGGTLLGAVRHKGFIPWDDDVDVNMPRPDCEKLMALSNGKIGPFELMPPNYSKDFYTYHWKLFGDDILVAKRYPGGIGQKLYPVFMDIFPIDGLPDTDAGNETHYKQIGRIKRKANHARGLQIYLGRNPFLILLNRALNLFYSKFGVKKYFDQVIELAKSIRYEDSEHVGVKMTYVHTTEERVVKSEYSPVVKLDFEGHKFSAPQGYDQYLKQLYGPKYMEWLPVHQRIARHNLVTFKRDTTKGRPNNPEVRESGKPESSRLDLQFDE